MNLQFGWIWPWHSWFCLLWLESLSANELMFCTLIDPIPSRSIRYNLQIILMLQMTTTNLRDGIKICVVYRSNFLCLVIRCTYLYHMRFWNWFIILKLRLKPSHQLHLMYHWEDSTISESDRKDTMHIILLMSWCCWLG